MASIFSGSEIVELGIQIEENGRDFYNALVKKSKHEKAKDVFKFLALEEEKHISVFRGILDSVGRYEPPEAYPGEYFAYMNALAGDYVFTKKKTGEVAAKKAASDAQAVDAGIGFEKDSILFYEGMKKVVSEYDQGVVEEMIAQEQGHLRKLSDLRAGLKQ